MLGAVRSGGLINGQEAAKGRRVGLYVWGKRAGQKRADQCRAISHDAKPRQRTNPRARVHPGKRCVREAASASARAAWERSELSTRLGSKAKSVR